MTDAPLDLDAVLEHGLALWRGLSDTDRVLANPVLDDLPNLCDEVRRLRKRVEELEHNAAAALEKAGAPKGGPDAAGFLTHLAHNLNEHERQEQARHAPDVRWNRTDPAP